VHQVPNASNQGHARAPERERPASDHLPPHTQLPRLPSPLCALSGLLRSARLSGRLAPLWRVSAPLRRLPRPESLRLAPLMVLAPFLPRGTFLSLRGCAQSLSDTAHTARMRPRGPRKHRCGTPHAASNPSHGPRIPAPRSNHLAPSSAQAGRSGSANARPAWRGPAGGGARGARQES